MKPDFLQSFFEPNDIFCIDHITHCINKLLTIMGSYPYVENNF